MKHTIVTSIALVTLLALACDAQAFWGSRGSYGSYGGSYGSYGSAGSYGSSGSYGSAGSYGSYGSRGGLFSRIRARRWARGSYGSYGSYAVSYGSSGSYGSNGSYGSCGSYGGTYIDQAPSGTYQEVPSDTAPAPTEAASHTSAGLLRVEVPADAKVYINGKLTTSTGTERQYVSYGLESGRNYSYEVRVEYTQDGKAVSETKQIALTAGSNELLAFTSTLSAEPVATKLQLRVPAEARVTLAGVGTQQTGTEREYMTTKLATGQEWANYRVVVELADLKQEQTITLRGGEVQSLEFDFAGATNTLALRD